MANALDLLNPTVRDLRADEALDERTAESLARMRPEELGAYMAYKGGRGITSGAGQLAGGALGVDVRGEDEKYTDSIRKVKDQIVAEGLNPSNPDAYYPRVIQLMAQNRLPSQAAAMQREYQKMQLDNRRADLGNKREERMAKRDEATDARAQERNDLIATRLGASKDRVLQYMARLETTTDPEQRRQLTALINNLAQGKLVFRDAGGEIVVYNPDGTIADRTNKSVSPDAQLRADTQRDLAERKLNAKSQAATTAQVAVYKAVKDKTQDIYDNIVTLANHPGLSNITGRINGAIGGTDGAGGRFGTGTRTTDGRAALALVDQVTGQAFLNALTGLRSEAKNGASGLGQVTEREGDRLVQAAAALNRQQDTSDFFDSLVKYARKVRQMAERLDENAGTDQLVPLTEREFKMAGEQAAAKPSRRRDDTPTAAAPAKAAPAAAAPAADGETKMLAPPDKTGKRIEMWVVNADVPRAKAAGWKEIK